MIQSRYSRWAVIISIFAVLLAAVWIRSFAQGNDIPYGQTVTGNIKAGITDTWHFISTAGDLIAITVERTSGNLEPVLTLQDPAQQSVAGNQADSGQGKASLTQVRLAQSGSHLIQISGNNQTTGDYKLTVTLIQASLQTPTLEPTSATRVIAGRVDPGAKVRGDLKNGVYRQFWNFRGNFGDIVDIRMIRISGNLDPALSLISPIQDVVAINSSENGGPDAGILGFQLHTQANTLSWRIVKAKTTANLVLLRVATR